MAAACDSSVCSNLVNSTSVYQAIKRPVEQSHGETARLAADSG
jgi:hypothetical protein